MLLLLVAVLGTAGCDSSSSEDDPFIITYDPTFNTTTFQDRITNPYFPLTPGTRWQYEGQTDEGLERVLVEVMDETRVLAGVTATVVRDRVFVDGSLIEDTYDWFAQDQSGNVWYLSEDSKEIENGQVTSSAGSWEAGVDGAIAGINMPATPAVGQAFYQEFYAGEAEDRAVVLAVNESVTVAAGTYTNCVKTEDTTPLEPDVLEHKYYCPGVGTVLTEDLEGDERSELMSMETRP